MGRRISADNTKAEKKRPRKGRGQWLKAEEKKRKRKAANGGGKRWLHLSPEAKHTSRTVAILFSDVINARNNVDRNGWILVWFRTPSGEERAGFLCMTGFDAVRGKYSSDDLARAIKRQTTTTKPKKGAP